ncbi:N-acylneuraminate-9-phosphatase [Aplochiton taeniatus]
MDSKVVTVILFDLDNTLIETARAGELAIQKTRAFLKTTLSQDDNTIDDICHKFKLKLLRESFDSNEGKTIDEVRIQHWEGSIQEVVGSRPRPTLASECYYLWKNSRLELLRISPEVCNLLKELRTRYKLLLLTNGESQTQREKVAAVGCEDLFDAIVVGGDHVEEKPAVSIFTHCFSLLGARPQDCVMVGDSLETDILGGFQAGVLATVWINSVGGPLTKSTAIPDFTIPSVLDLPTILADI